MSWQILAASGMFSYKFFFSITVEREKQIKRAKQRAKNQTKPNQTRPDRICKATRQKKIQKKKKGERKNRNENKGWKRSNQEKSRFEASAASPSF